MNLVSCSGRDQEAEQQRSIIRSLAAKGLVAIHPMLGTAGGSPAPPALRHLSFNGDVVAVKLRQAGGSGCRALGLVVECGGGSHGRPFLAVRLFGSHYDLHHRRYVWYPTAPETTHLVHWDDLLATVGSLDRLPPTRYTPHVSWAPRAHFARAVQRALDAEGWVDAQAFLERFPALALAGTAVL